MWNKKVWQNVFARTSHLWKARGKTNWFFYQKLLFYYSYNTIVLLIIINASNFKLPLIWQPFQATIEDVYECNVTTDRGTIETLRFHDTEGLEPKSSNLADKLPRHLVNNRRLDLYWISDVSTFISVFYSWWCGNSVFNRWWRLFPGDFFSGFKSAIFTRSQITKKFFNFWLKVAEAIRKEAEKHKEKKEVIFLSFC